MQQKCVSPMCNYSNRETTDLRTGWSLSPVQGIDRVLTNRYGVNANVDDTFSLFYCDLYLSELKETLKHTMLVHESIIESQIHELHRLYRRQKELMMEMEGTRSFPSPRTHWMNLSVSPDQTRNIPNQIEAIVNLQKSGKKVLDLELPVFEYSQREDERSSMIGQVNELSNHLQEPLSRRMSLESNNQSKKLQLDLNEPAKIEEHSDYVFDQFLSPVTPSKTREKSYTKNEGEHSVNDSKGMNEAQGSVKCCGENGIDLNMSPLSCEEEVLIAKKFEAEKPQESLSVSLHEKMGSERVIIQALPCSTSILLLAKQYKPLMTGSRPRKKVKIDPSSKTSKGSDLDLHSSAQATSESQSNQTSEEKESSSSLTKEESAGNQTNLGKKKRCKRQMKSSKDNKVVAKKSGRMKQKKKKSRRISLVTEGNYQEVSAAEAIVDMSRKSSQETAECVTSLAKILLWFAEIASLVGEDTEIDVLEAMTLQLREKKIGKRKTDVRLKSSDNKSAVSSIILGRRRRSRARLGKRTCKDNQHSENPSLGTSSECEANEDLQVIGKLIEASELKWIRGFPKNKSKDSPSKPIDIFNGVEWGTIKKRRRGSRSPAAEFQRMIINQVQPK